jgi:hypothetical protein
MAIGIGAGGYVGVAFETVVGTYTAPTRFFPIHSESLKYTQETTFRRPIRKTAAVIGAIKGNARIEGDISMDALSTAAPYFHHASRATVAKAGSTNYTYTYTPSPAALPPNKTLSITVVRNGIAFGYTNCVVQGFEYTVNNGMLSATYHILGADEGNQTLPTPTFDATDPVFGAGSWAIENPIATPVTDVDTFTFSVNDNGSAEYRLRNTAAAAFIRFGEQEATMSLERDFQDATEYTAWKALTNKSMKVTASYSANESISFSLTGGVYNDYTINLGGQGDLIRASASLTAIADATGAPYTLVVKSAENIT